MKRGEVSVPLGKIGPRRENENFPRCVRYKYVKKKKNSKTIPIKIL